MVRENGVWAPGSCQASTMVVSSVSLFLMQLEVLSMGNFENSETAMLPLPTLCSTTVCYPLSVSPKFSLERALVGMARVGLTSVELVAIPGYCPHLDLNCMNDEATNILRSLLYKHGLSAIAINVSADLTLESGLAYLYEAMRLAQALSVQIVVTNIDQTELEIGAMQFSRNLPKIVRYAEECDVVVGLETHGGLIKTGQQGVEFLKRFGSDRLKITYDTANVIYCGGIKPDIDLAGMANDIGKYVGYVHLKDKANLLVGDYNFPAFGYGILNFGTILKLLYEGGYRGPMSLEVELDGRPVTPELVDSSLATSLSYLKQYFI